MTNRPRGLLVVLLRIIGVSALFALGAVVMPLSWMHGIHRWLGLGEMPTAPIVEYLARSLSAFYAVFGGLCLMVSTDLERFLPMVRFIGISFLLMGIAFTGIDLASGMPWWWSAFEGPPGIFLGIGFWYLAQYAENVSPKI